MSSFDTYRKILNHKFIIKGEIPPKFMHIDDLLPAKIKLGINLQYQIGQYLDYLNQELLPNDISDVFNIKYEWMESKGLTSSKTEFAASEFERLKSCRFGLFVPYLKHLKSLLDEAIDFRALIIALNFKGGVLTGTYANQAEILRRDFGVTKTQSTLERVLSNLAPNKDFLEYQIKDNTAIHSDKERYARIKQIYDSGGIDQYINDLSGN